MKINNELQIQNHALRSLLLVNQFINLNEDEKVTILAHDGFYEYSNREYWMRPSELMMLIHFADLYCARIVEAET